MGAKIFAVAGMIAILAFAGINSYIVNERIDDIIEDVSECQKYEDVKEIREKFLEYERYINITVSHEDLTIIEDLFSQYEAELLQDSEGAEITKGRLINALLHLRRLSGINIDSIT